MGWIGNSILFLASYLLGHRKRYAFILVAIGELIWMVRAWQLAAWDLMACCAVFLVLALKNYRLWRQNDFQNLSLLQEEARNGG